MDMHERSSNPLLTFLSLGTTNCHYLRTDSYPCLHRCGKLFKQTTLATRADLNSFPFISNFHGCPFKLSAWNSYGCLLFSEPTLQIFQIWFNGISIHLKTSMKTSFEIHMLPQSDADLLQSCCQSRIQGTQGEFLRGDLEMAINQVSKSKWLVLLLMVLLPWWRWMMMVII